MYWHEYFPSHQETIKLTPTRRLMQDHLQVADLGCALLAQEGLRPQRPKTRQHSDRSTDQEYQNY